MPRRKHAFIDRSKATTYQLVHRSAANGEDAAPVLVPVNADTNQAEQAGSAADTVDHYLVQKPHEEGQRFSGEQLQFSYRKKDYELGEFGFPDDGYDYRRHFKTIGGGGGVFMDAITGKPNPDAVKGTSSSVSATTLHAAKDAVLLHDDIVNEGAISGTVDTWKRKEDILRYQRAVEDIKRDRKKNKELEIVFGALDSDGELDFSAPEEEGGALDLEQIAVEDGNDSDVLEDNFIAIADNVHHTVKDINNNLEGIREKYREPRLLDEQFAKIMQGYEHPDHEDDDDCFPDEELQHIDNLADFQAHMTNDDLERVFDGALLDDMAALTISTEENDGELCHPASLHDDPDFEQGVHNATGLTSGPKDRVTEYQEFADAEFERGMKVLLDSYTRVSAVEALEAIDGVDGALEAIARTEEEEKAKDQKRAADGLDDESDGHDSELESRLDDLFKEPEERWDCATIISTYSNLENHPSVIDAPTGRKRGPVQKQPIIRLDPRTQAPVDYMPVAVDASETTQVDFGSRREVAKDAQVRSRDETKEEKKARKAAVKEAARVRRALKSEMKKAFGSEQVRQDRHSAAMGTSKVAMQF